VPINTASYVGVPEEKGGEVSGTINLLRNIGGSVGISVVETMIARRSTAAAFSIRVLRGRLFVFQFLESRFQFSG
jgi:hypothetical protein